MDSTEAIVKLYDEENQKLKRRVATLENKLAMLQVQKTTHLKSNELLNVGNEKELYPGEIRELLMDILKTSRKNIKDNTRRADIIDDLLAHNAVQEIPKKQTQSIKNILRGYKTVNATMLRQLEKIGLFEITRGKHIKFRYYGDKRYIACLAGSGSDTNCGGMNLANELATRFF